ncbi:glycerophosphodiester phosphodiesterase family protein, partial [uncultured Aquabacterium sp.]
VHQAFLNARRIEAIHAAGMKSLAYTVNDAERAGTLWLSGLDGMVTDRVDLFEPQARLGACPGLNLVPDVLIA